MPDFEVKLNALYNLQNKFIFDMGVNLVGNRNALVYETNPNDYVINFDGVSYDVNGGNLFLENLKPYVDLNLGIEYRYTKRLSFFLDLNNIADVQYQTFDRYYVQGIQVLGGLTLSFRKIVMSTNIVKENYLVTREEREIQNKHKSGVLWFTGLSGSGKSTAAKHLEKSIV